MIADRGNSFVDDSTPERFTEGPGPGPGDSGDCGGVIGAGVTVSSGGHRATS